MRPPRYYGNPPQCSVGDEGSYVESGHGTRQLGETGRARFARSAKSSTDRSRVRFRWLFLTGTGFLQDLLQADSGWQCRRAERQLPGPTSYSQWRPAAVEKSSESGGMSQPARVQRFDWPTCHPPPSAFRAQPGIRSKLDSATRRLFHGTEAKQVALCVFTQRDPAKLSNGKLGPCNLATCGNDE